MSVACGEFAEHVWKPGSCKNCFHPRSAHVPAGSARVSTGSGPGEAEEGTVPFPPPHNKPTIAVRPTMMSNDNGDTTADLGVNPQQELRKMMDLGPLFINGPTCRSTLLQSAVQGTLEYSGKFSPSAGSPPGFLSDTRVISNIYVTQGDGRVPHSLKENANGGYPPSGPGPRHLPSGGFGEVVAEVTAEVVRDPQAPLGVAIDIIATVPSNGVTVVTEQPSSACTSPVRTRGSRHASLSDSGSYGSSTGSLSGAEPFGLAPPLSPGTPATPTSPGSPLSDGQDRPRDAEPIYAESTKRKRRPPQQRTELNVGVNGSEGGQRATITMVAAHTEENNRTFYLSSPDSAVSSQWTHLSPSAAATPTFTWPAVPVATETASPKPQSSPPVPPKRTSRSPKLGASSLSPVPLPELSLPPAKATAAPPAASLTPGPHPERRHKLLSSGWSREGRIEEEEEEQEEADGEAQTRSPRRGSAGLVNGGSVWRGCKEGGTEPGEASAAATANNNGARQQQGRGSVSMLANANPKTERPAPPAQTAEHPSGTNTSHEPTPPPPPPKKHHRVSTKMNASSVDLDRGSQQGSVESLTQSVRGAASTSASTDSLHSDAGPQDSAQHSCPSPFPSSPLASSPGSPHPDPFPSNALARQVQPPPLPEKKLVNRTVSAPSEGGGRALVRGRPRLPFCGSEGNVNRPDAAGTPPGSAEPPHHHASDDSLRSRTLDEPQVKGRGRLLGQSRGAAASCSSPQLSVASATTPPRNGAGGSSLRLQSLLSNMDSRECVYSKLGGLYAESLRRLALKCEEHFTRGQRNTLRFDESSWSLFKLTCNKPSCLAGDAVYYSAACASDPSNTYAVKICKSQGPESRQQHLHGLAVQQTLPAHFSLQQECGHFIACVPQSMLPSEGPPGPAASAAPAPAPAPPGSPAAPPQAEHERVVVITRDVPWQTAADFVREWAEFHRAQPEAYERRVCFLLLQLCNGLEHLKGHGVTHRDLCLENLLLVPHRRDPVSPAGGADPRQQQLPRLLVSSFGKAKQRGGAPGDDPVANADPRLKRDHARLAPEIVSAAQYRKFDEFQTGILVYELLHQPNPFEVRPELREQEYRMEELPRLPCASLYSSGLQRLAHLLLQPDPIKRIHIQDAKRALQCLLWGPRQEMLDLPWSAGSAPGSGSSSGSRYEGLLNWLDVKRALLMMKFAERSLEPERTAELEDWLCCQYFSSAHPLALCHTAELLHGAKHTH